MDQLGLFLKKFKKFKIPQEEARNFCVMYCNSFLKDKLSVSNIRISGGVVYIKAPPLLKGEIFLRKDKLLEELNKNISTKGVVFKDVR